MKKFLKIFLISFIIILILILVLLGFDYYKSNTFTAVVIKVKENSLTVMKGNTSQGLYNINIHNFKDMEFQQGQEVFIFYLDKIIPAIYPPYLSDIASIKIIKEQSDIVIPDDILRQYYSSKDNVTITINELTNSKISLTITDTNSLPYEYSNNYRIFKKNNIEIPATIDESKIIPATENSTSAYIPDTSSIKPAWEEVSKAEIDTEKSLIHYNKINEYSFEKTYDWSNIYGALEERKL